MTDDQIADAIALAIELQENGQVKEAYFAFTAASQKAMALLNEIKFVHSTIISKPTQYSDTLLHIKTCLSHIENIIENHSPSVYKPVSRHTTGGSVTKPPPPIVPPKPTRMQKPLVPPKPSPKALPTNNSKPIHELQDNSNESIKAHVYENSPNSRPLSLPPLSRSTQPLHSNRPYTEIHQSNTSDISIIAEGGIDPNYLVPAQTNPGDSLAPSLSSLNIDHVPLIPAPPLLTTHRDLQYKVNDLEKKIKSCRDSKQGLLRGEKISGTFEGMSEESLDDLIFQYNRALAEHKFVLNGIRTTYMSAATIPTVLQFQPHIIAYQITLIEAAIFDAIPPVALLEHSSKNPNPRIVASTDFFNYITRCIEHSVLLPQEASSRAQLIHFWIKVASRCHDLNNYQTLKAIISALNTPPVQRLKRTWSYIPKKSSTKLDAMNDLMSEANNYGQYREHMGMVSTSTVNGKPIQQIRNEHYTKPTVPFLGTFIHDITYLLAAFKSSPLSSSGRAEDEPRIKEVLTTIKRFQRGPRYAPSAPALFLKSVQKHHFRPAISNVLHRGASHIQRMSGSNLFGFESSGRNSGSSNNGHANSISSSTSSSSIHNSTLASSDDVDEDASLEEQQRMAMQYILMRPWVSQNTVDELSTLREPPPQIAKSVSMYGHRSSSTGGGTSSINNRTSSMFSNSSSNVRLSTGSVSLSTLSTGGGSDSRPTSMEDHEDLLMVGDPKRGAAGQNGFFSSFRRSDGGGATVGRPVTIHEGLERTESGLSREEQENFHVVIDKRATWDGHAAPIVPPRPTTKPSANEQRFY